LCCYFNSGASLSEGGRPIIVLPSTTHDGRSRIVPFIKPGGGILTTRAHVHYIVTEWGTAYLYGKNTLQRAKELIRIAHPDHRDWLEKQYEQHYWLSDKAIVEPSPPSPPSPSS
jgi:acyl-CoA hydrolase